MINRHCRCVTGVDAVDTNVGGIYHLNIAPRRRTGATEELCRVGIVRLNAVLTVFSCKSVAERPERVGFLL